jgi:hypothetical protein
LNEHLTPPQGWETPQYYAEEIEEEGELYINYSNDDEELSGLDLWYSTCNNQYLSEPLPKGHCPLVTLPNIKYDSLEGFFGNVWKPIFKEWFQHHTGLPVKQVDFDA